MIPIDQPIETAELVAFARVVEARSLTRAAAELEVPRATIGRRIARLEQRLGTRLLRRTTRSLSLTEAGEGFLRHARIVLDAIRQAEDSLRQADQAMRGTLRVSVPAGIEESFFAFIAGFAREFPDVRLQVEMSTRMVDLVREGYDVALRATSALPPGLIARPLVRHQLVAVASPAYLAEHGTPRTRRQLAGHRCLTGFARGELPQATWPTRRGAVAVDSVLSSNSLLLLREAALHGVGIAFIPERFVADALAGGELVQVLPNIVEAEMVVAVVFSDRELLPPHVRVFVDRLVDWGTRALAEGPSRSIARSRRK